MFWGQIQPEKQLTTPIRGALVKQLLPQPQRKSDPMLVIAKVMVACSPEKPQWRA